MFRRELANITEVSKRAGVKQIPYCAWVSSVMVSRIRSHRTCFAPVAWSTICHFDRSLIKVHVYGTLVLCVLVSARVEITRILHSCRCSGVMIGFEHFVATWYEIDFTRKGKKNGESYSGTI